MICNKSLLYLFLHIINRKRIMCPAIRYNKRENLMKYHICYFINALFIFFELESTSPILQSSTLYAPKPIYPFQKEFMEEKNTNISCILESTKKYFENEQYNEIFELFTDKNFTDLKGNLTNEFLTEISTDIIVILVDYLLQALEKTNFPNSILQIFRQIDFINAADVITYNPQIIPVNIAFNWTALLTRTLNKLDFNVLTRKPYFEQLLIRYKEIKFINEDYSPNKDIFQNLSFEDQLYFISEIMGALNETNKFRTTLEIAKQINIMDKNFIVSQEIYSLFLTELEIAENEIKKRKTIN